jgi:hypothetical protein
MPQKYPEITSKIETKEDLADLEIYLEQALAKKEINMLQWEEIYDEAAENMKLKRKEKMLNTVPSFMEKDIEKGKYRNKGSKKNEF